MSDNRTAPYAALLMRLSLGILFLAHFGLKFFVFTPSGTAKFFESLGLPGGLAYLTMAVELIGGFALIFGIYMPNCCYPINSNPVRRNFQCSRRSRFLLYKS